MLRCNKNVKGPSHITIMMMIIIIIIIIIIIHQQQQTTAADLLSLDIFCVSFVYREEVHQEMIRIM